MEYSKIFFLAPKTPRIFPEKKIVSHVSDTIFWRGTRALVELARIFPPIPIIEKFSLPLFSEKPMREQHESNNKTEASAELWKEEEIKVGLHLHPPSTVCNVSPIQSMAVKSTASRFLLDVDARAASGML